MMKNSINGTLSPIEIVFEKTKAFTELLKAKLSLLVVFSAGFGYILSYSGSNSHIDFQKLAFLILGGFCLTCASNILNQVLEKDLDILMNRTKIRPLPTARISIQEAVTFSLVLIAIGLLILILKVNVFSAFLTLVSLLLYAFFYTPMKRISPFAVLIGAFPGAMPPLIGWVANTNHIGVESLTIFGLQFIWQFPHFWAIAWVLDEDYKRAGFRLLPSVGGRDMNTAFQIMIYTLFLIPIGLLPTKLGIVGINSAFVTTICGVLFLAQTFYLMKEGTEKAAKSIMLGSFLYLPIVQITFMLDRL